MLMIKNVGTSFKFHSVLSTQIFGKVSVKYHHVCSEKFHKRVNQIIRGDYTIYHHP